MPEQLYNGLFNTQRHEEIASILDLKQEEYLVFDKEAMIEAFDHQDQEDVYEIIDRQYELYEKQGCSDEEINRQIKRYIEDYIAHLLDRMVKTATAAMKSCLRSCIPVSIRRWKPQSP